MLYDDFLSLVNLLPDDIGDIYVRGPKKMVVIMVFVILIVLG